jgi:hypothetical protein
MQSGEENLRKRILQEMTVDYSKVLEENFGLAKQFIRLTKEGEVEILVKEKTTGQEKILLYLIGKLYAKEARLTSSAEVGNQELIENLGMPQGSLLPWLKGLRDENKIKQIKRERHTFHTIPISLVGKTLKQIDKKLKRHWSEEPCQRKSHK